MESNLETPVEKVAQIRGSQLETLTHNMNVRRSNRATQDSSQYLNGAQCMMATAGNKHMDDPRSYKNPIDLSYHEKRRDAMGDDIRTIH